MPTGHPGEVYFIIEPLLCVCVCMCVFSQSTNRTQILLKEMKLPVKTMSELVCLDCGQSRLPVAKPRIYRKQMVFLAAWDEHPALSGA